MNRIIDRPFTNKYILNVYGLYLLNMHTTPYVFSCRKTVKLVVILWFSSILMPQKSESFWLLWFLRFHPWMIQKRTILQLWHMRRRLLLKEPRSILKFSSSGRQKNGSFLNWLTLMIEISHSLGWVLTRIWWRVSSCPLDYQSKSTTHYSLLAPNRLLNGEQFKKRRRNKMFSRNKISRVMRRKWKEF